MTTWACPQRQMRAGARGWAGVPRGEVGQVCSTPLNRHGCSRSPQSLTRSWAKPSGPSTGPGSPRAWVERERAPRAHKGGCAATARGAVQRGRLCSPPIPQPRLLFLCQINNYLTVPAHKLDSPTMSRARIGSGKAGRGGPWRRASRLGTGPLSPEDEAPTGPGPQRVCREDGLLRPCLLPKP